MSDNTKIEWTDATWNPITGCSVVSPGCTNCYAMKLAGTRLRNHPSRAGLTQDTRAGPVWNGQVRFNEQWLDQPLRWRSPRMIFVNAHGDLFHESVPDEWIDRIFAVMALADWHTYQVLTKRADRMRQYLSRRTAEIEDDLFQSPMARALVRASLDAGHRLPGNAALLLLGNDDSWRADTSSIRRTPGWPLRHAWLGVSAEDQRRYDERVEHLRNTPAAVRWVSAEPLLGAINADLRGIDWLVAGGESGNDARPMHPEWAQRLRDQCAIAGVPFFFKQWGNWRSISQGGPDWYDSLYRSNRIAKDGEDQAVLDEMSGRRCTVPTICVRRDDHHVPANSPLAFLADTGSMLAFNVGKKAAGRLLDGLEHNGFPKGQA